MSVRSLLRRAAGPADAVLDAEATRLLAGVGALLLDLDGTLTSVGARRLRVWRGIAAEGRVLAHLGAAMARARGARHADLDGVLSAELARRAGVDRVRARRALVEVVDRDWPRAFAGAQVPPGLARLLRVADAAGVPRAIWSDHPALDKLEAMGVGGWAAVCGARRVGALKPLPDGGWGLLAQLGVAPAAALLIGDRDDTDGLAAAGLGCRYLPIGLVEARLGGGRLLRRATLLV